LRDFLSLAALSALGLPAHGAQGKVAAALPPGIGTDPDFDGLLPEPKRGNKPPTRADEKIAKAILSKAPAGPTPYDVAKYFLYIAQGRYGKTWQPFAQGWPVKWNPVIVNFFQATQTSPNGDLTSWCAAFANWCIQQSGKGPATHSASSGSFREFGMETLTPLPGDIVVFSLTDSDPSTDMHGHVGFFVTDHGDDVEVLGGNQIEGHERCHKISLKRIKKQNRTLTLHSYRTDARLHRQTK
jgi:uncharacterized protein (TIGR02594 family)